MLWTRAERTVGKLAKRAEYLKREIKKRFQPADAQGVAWVNGLYKEIEKMRTGKEHRVQAMLREVMIGDLFEESRKKVDDMEEDIYKEKASFLEEALKKMRFVNYRGVLMEKGDFQYDDEIGRLKPQAALKLLYEILNSLGAIAYDPERVLAEGEIEPMIRVEGGSEEESEEDLDEGGD
jgi:hypothetical protein